MIQEIGSIVYCYFRPIDVCREGPTSSDREVLLLIKRNTDDGDFWANQEGWDVNVDDLNKWLGITE